jgi:GTP-binding protein YchF
MSLSIGIVGLPNVGKSTLFNALTKNSVPAENFPFCTIDPSVGIVPVPDERLEKLDVFSHSKKKIPAIVEFVDIAGLVKGAAQGEGLGNQFLTHIREVDAIAQVVRIFEDPNITHVHDEINPLGDIEVINYELVMRDLQTVEKRLQNVEKEARRNVKEAVAEKAVLEKLQASLETGKLANQTALTKEELPVVKQLALLSAKPFIYVLNKKTGGKNIDQPDDERFQKLLAFFEATRSPWVVIDAGIESELRDLEKAEKEEMKQGLGAGDSGLDQLIQKGYELLDLITFFTTGEDETRAWTIRRGFTAPQAGAAIHTDFMDRFIKADVIHCEELLHAGSYPKARELGLVRTEGKTYIVKDGDVIVFKI